MKVAGQIDDLNIGDEILVGSGLSTLNNIDMDFKCIFTGYDEKGLAVLDAQNAVSFDGKNKILPIFVVDRRTVIEKVSNHYRPRYCYVLYDMKGMDLRGRLILQTLCKRKADTTWGEKTGERGRVNVLSP